MGGVRVEVSGEEVADDWAERWQRFHEPVLVGGRLFVRPPWDRAAAGRDRPRDRPGPGVRHRRASHHAAVPGAAAGPGAARARSPTSAAARACWRSPRRSSASRRSPRVDNERGRAGGHARERARQRGRARPRRAARPARRARRRPPTWSPPTSTRPLLLRVAELMAEPARDADRRPACSRRRRTRWRRRSRRCGSGAGCRRAGLERAAALAGRVAPMRCRPLRPDRAEPSGDARACSARTSSSQDHAAGAAPDRRRSWAAGAAAARRRGLGGRDVHPLRHAQLHPRRRAVALQLDHPRRARPDHRRAAARLVPRPRRGARHDREGGRRRRRRGGRGGRARAARPRAEGARHRARPDRPRRPPPTSPATWRSGRASPRRPRTGCTSAACG